MSEDICLQQKYAPNNACFGCGQANPKGLKIQSFPKDNGQVVATWKPEVHHEAFPGILNGGIIGALLDCHSNWTAIWHLMQKSGNSQPPSTVTAEYSVKLLRPTPTQGAIELIAEPVDIQEDHALIKAELRAGGKVCATCTGKFVAVKPGHPAYHRW